MIRASCAIIRVNLRPRRIDSVSPSSRKLPSRADYEFVKNIFIYRSESHATIFHANISAWYWFEINYLCHNYLYLGNSRRRRFSEELGQSNLVDTSSRMKLVHANQTVFGSHWQFSILLMKCKWAKFSRRPRTMCLDNRIHKIEHSQFLNAHLLRYCVYTETFLHELLDEIQ